MRRAVLGILGLVLIVGGFALYLAGFETSASGFASGVMVKTGAVLLLFWLAYHQVLRLFEVVPPWMIGAALVGMGVLIAFPRSWVVVLCVFAALIALHVAGLFLNPDAKRQARPRTKSPIANPNSQRGARRDGHSR